MSDFYSKPFEQVFHFDRKIFHTNPMALLGPVATRQLSQLFIALLFFHISEFILAVIIHGASRVNVNSFLISNQYIFAMICGLIEYAIEYTFVPELKMQWWVSNIGLVMVVTGELVRKTGIITARRGFTHDIRMYLRDDHELVTNGIYSYIRHPGYSGFFIWSVGTQVMLCNPLCTIGYALVTWRFFEKRIRYEEFFLRRFFNYQYVEYAQRVPSGIPFIK
jgi:protein-S-isoprenylcysteine O-methyltransferase